MPDYSHISFQKDWSLSDTTWYKLGQCKSIIKAISNAPIQPQYREKLLQISLRKGAKATTAIEGNTLSLEEILEIQEGKSLQESKEYQEIEVKNILDSFNEILEEIIVNKKKELVSENLILRFHKMIGRDLGDSLQAIPGQFRKRNVSVGSYKPPNYHEVEKLINDLCKWLKEEFKFTTRSESFSNSVIEAIVCHVYIAWIHPFSDGNGRTARLLEFYILLRAGLPTIATHVLSNFYNDTRSEYYRQLEKATREKSLSNFIEYAVRGFRDELIKILEIIQDNHFHILWINYIYEIFKDIKYGNMTVFKRRRELILKFPVNEWLTQKELVESHPDLMRTYLRKSNLFMKRDLEELIKLNLVVNDKNKYKANTELLISSLPTKN
ncbi:MAG: Fic family protein [Bacteroidetes bacterium]|nr:Fic family protein [Bacteroidota bacterium]